MNNEKLTTLQYYTALFVQHTFCLFMCVCVFDTAADLQDDFGADRPRPRQVDRKRRPNGIGRRRRRRRRRRSSQLFFE